MTEAFIEHVLHKNKIHRPSQSSHRWLLQLSTLAGTAKQLEDNARHSQAQAQRTAQVCVSQMMLRVHPRVEFYR